MNHTHPMFEVLDNLTVEEKLDLLDFLMDTDCSHVNLKLLAPSIPQYKELRRLKLQYEYQSKMAERELNICPKEQVDEKLIACGRAQGAVEILEYIMSTTQEELPDELK